MRRTSLVHAKAHLSELVDDAEHKKKPVIILRHGKPAAAIVPVEAVAGFKRAEPRRMTDEEARRSVETFVEEFSAAEPYVSAVEDLLAGRR